MQDYPVLYCNISANTNSIPDHYATPHAGWRDLSLENSTLTALVVSTLEDLKGQNIETYDVRDLTAVTDCMVLCTGSSSTHVKALADEVIKKAKENNVSILGVEGLLQADWVLVDLGPVVVHIMQAATRSMYRLEDLWSFSPDTTGAGSTAESGKQDPNTTPEQEASED